MHSVGHDAENVTTRGVDVEGHCHRSYLVEEDASVTHGLSVAAGAGPAAAGVKMRLQA